MANYIGNTPANGEFKHLDSIASQFNGSTVTFSLVFNGVIQSAGDASQLIVSLNGVIQEPLTAYTLGTGGSTITFSSAPASGGTCFIVMLGGVGGTVTPSDNSVTTAKIASNSVTTAKIASGAVTSSKISIDGNISFPDNNKLIFGGGSDLQIYHNGTDSNTYIDETVGGSLFIRDNNNIALKRLSDNANMVVGRAGAEVELYHNGDEKLATTATGITVTGVTTSTGFSGKIHPVNGTTTNYLSLKDSNELNFYNSSNVSQTLNINYDGGDLDLAGSAVVIKHSGGNVGIGETNPQYRLHLSKSGSNYIQIDNDTNSVTSFLGVATDHLWLGTSTNHQLKFYANSDIKMVIDTNGKVGIGTGTSSLTHKLEVVGTTKAEQYLLDAVAKDISDTAVDVFIYDTRKDSDGGAWRKRTQHTSWYNETLNTATRGARKEFPAVAVIVAESNQVTIYDGDDPDMPMWMVFNDASNYFLNQPTVSAVAMLNGKLAVTGTASNNTSLAIGDFVSEFCQIIRSNYDGDATGLVNRNQSFWSANKGNTRIVGNVVNDVAMTVLPNAPIDAATGLPVPTIAVATDGGVSIIKDNGTVVDVNDNLGGTRPVTQVKIRGNDITTWNVNNGTMQQFFDALNLTSDSTNDCKYNYSYNGGGGGTENITAILRATLSGSVHLENGETYRDIHLANADGISKIHDGYDREFSTNTFSIFDSLVAYMTSDYNTGWMNGDIKLATLSDTDSTNVTGSELVANGLFNNGGDWSFGGGWNFANGQAEIDSNNNDLLSQDIGMVSGKTYTVTLYVAQYTDGYVSVRLGGTEIGTASAIGFYAFTGVAAGSTLQIYGFTNPTLAVDDISVRLAEEDRSVNGKGLQVFGSITKTPVATGADLVAYSGFSASNYLQQPINTDIQNTNPRAFVCWVKATQQASGYRYLWTLTNDSNYHYGLSIHEGTSGNGGKLYTYDQEHGISVSSYMVADGSWHCVFFTDDEVDKKIYVDGNLVHTVNHGYDLNSANKQAMKLRIGTYDSGGYPMTNGSLSLLRVSGNIPSADQIKKIYEDEKFLFQENAKATLYGSSNTVTALAYDDDTELLHAGTSAGRSVFQGLRRIDNTTDAVGSAISASNGMVAED